MFTLGAAAGGLSAMVLNDLLGRKLSIMFSAVPSVIGYALMAGARGLWMLLLGRTLTGFAGGLTAACIPVRPDVSAASGLFRATPASEPLLSRVCEVSYIARGTSSPSTKEADITVTKSFLSCVLTSVLCIAQLKKICIEQGM